MSRNQHEAGPEVKQFPSGRHAAVTWTIPDNYGGMTKALLHRSEQFVKLGHTNVDILTFAWRGSYEVTRDRLRSKGALVDGMRLLNFWEEVSNMTDAELKGLVSGHAVVDEARYELTHMPKAEPSKAINQKKWKDSEKEDSKVAGYYRPDGTVFLSVSGAPEGDRGSVRSVRVYSTHGTVMGEWTTIRDLYFAWLDYWHAGEESYMIIDSKFVAEFMIEYRRPNVATVYMVHGSHLQANDQTPYSELSKSREKAFQNMHSFDAVCVLTDKQYKHVSTRLGSLGNLHVVPNGYTPPTKDAEDVQRDPNRGVMLAILTKRKRVHHAINAMSLKRDERPGGVSLHVFGSGEEEDNLRNLVSDLDCSEIVSFDGFTSDPATEFEKASFSLLTSTAEGFPLVLLEMMSAGCVPIAYDVNYGPSQIIEDGVSGYLVQGENEEALRNAIDKLLSLPPSKVVQMRSAARARALQFSDRSVVDLWKSVLRAAFSRKFRSSGDINYRVDSPVVTFAGNGVCKLSCEIEFATDSYNPFIGDRVLFAAYLRNGGLFFRKNVSELIQYGRKYVISGEFEPEYFSGDVAQPLDFNVEIVAGDQRVKRRVPFGPRAHVPEFYGTTHGNLSARVTPR